MSDTYAFASLPACVTFTMEEAVSVKHYAIQSSAAADAPKEFYLEGSEDGETWTTLDWRTLRFWAGNETKRFILDDASDEFTYFRLRVTSTDSGEMGFNEFWLYPEIDQEKCATATATSEISMQDAEKKAVDTARANAALYLNCVRVWRATGTYVANCDRDYVAGSFGPNVTKSASANSINNELEAKDMAADAAKLAAVASLKCSRSNNEHGIIINDAFAGGIAEASPYPSVQYIESAITSLASVTVEIEGLTHSNPDDIHIVLISPSGTKVKLMQNCGGTVSISDVDLVFDQAAGSNLPDATEIVAGTYKPSQFGGAPTMPAPIPAGAENASLAALIGEDPNGSWSLWVADDSSADVGSISAWRLNIV